MVFNFIFFTLKIERNHFSHEERAAQYQQEQYLNGVAEAFKLEAARYPEFVSRI